jgi:hypothetical protein
VTTDDPSLWNLVPTSRRVPVTSCPLIDIAEVAAKLDLGPRSVVTEGQDLAVIDLPAPNPIRDSDGAVNDDRSSIEVVARAVVVLRLTPNALR